MNSGQIKMCTIHSFKGWEAHTLVVLLGADNIPSTDELLYTAITRCKKNLIIISTGENKYSDFFRENIRINKPISRTTNTHMVTDEDEGYIEKGYTEHEYRSEYGKDPEDDGLIYCSGDGLYHEEEDAWMFDGSCD